MEAALDRLTPDPMGHGAARADMVIEAIFEDAEAKRALYRQLEPRMRPDAILASNTSSIPLEELAGSLARPERLVGLHFFNPVEKMQLVEVVAMAASDASALARAAALVLAVRKLPLPVRSSPGFLVNRVLMPYLLEAVTLVEEGLAPEAIDRAAVDFGMPMGPLRLLDEVGLDVAHHVSGILYDAFGARMAPAPALTKLPETKRLGRKGGLGFYTYEGGRDKDVDPAMYAALGLPDQRQELPRDVIQERCLLVMINEAARVLEEGIVRGAGDVDLGLITGTGFPPFRGGLLRYADSLGTASVLEKLERYERQLGARFAPAALIRQRAASGTPFYASAERPVAVGV